MKTDVRIKTIRLTKAHSTHDLRHGWNRSEFGTDRYKERLNRFI